MKAKEFQFLVLNTIGNWQQANIDNFHNLVIDDRGVQIQSGLQFTQSKTRHFETVDFALGDLGQVYLLDAKKRRIVLFDSQQNYEEPIELFQDLFDRPAKIAYSSNTIYVADRLNGSNQTRIYAFAWRQNWQIRWLVDLQIGLEPIDLAVDPLWRSRSGDLDGAIFLLLKDESANQIVRQYNAASGQLIAEFATGQLSAAKAIAFAPNRDICILDAAAIAIFKADNNLTQPEFLELRGLIPEGMQPSGLTIDRQGNFYIGDRRPLIVGEEEDRFILCLDKSGENAVPVAGYRGAIAKLVLDRADRLFIFNFERQKIDILQGEKRFLSRSIAELPTGRFFSPAFDSTKTGQQWHKIVLDGEIPENTQIKVYYAISDERYGDRQWSQPLVNPKDALIRGPAGRYLYLKVELIGSEWQTPTLKSLRVEFPRLSYLRYLPAVYQEDEESRDFLERFLSIFETCLTDIERQIDSIVRYFDAEVVPEEFLPWLAGWLAIAVDENWTKAQLRKLIRQAPQLYQQRGTREGIAATIKIFTGFSPLLVESFQANTEELKQLYGDNQFRFWVLLDISHLENVEIETLQRLVDADKPAHTEARLKILQPSIALDRETYLGFNSRIFEPSLRLDRGAAISQESILTDSERFGQIGKRSRLDLDTLLN